MTMKSNCWVDGAVTLTNYTLIILRPACSHFLLTCSGPFHMVRITSLHLSSSHPIWLEHGPTQGPQKSRHDNNTIVMPITDESIDEWTPPVYVFYARGHVINLCPNGLEFKPCVECMSIT